jgi:hypothetical protein
LLELRKEKGDKEERWNIYSSFSAPDTTNSSCSIDLIYEMLPVYTR